MSANVPTVLAELQRLANLANVAGMARSGIVGKKLLGLTTVQLRTQAKGIGRNHQRAEALWSAGIFEACILAEFKKGVNWALRQTGKRNPLLNGEAIRAAKRIQKLDLLSGFIERKSESCVGFQSVNFCQ